CAGRASRSSTRDGARTGRARRTSRGRRASPLAPGRAACRPRAAWRPRPPTPRDEPGRGARRAIRASSASSRACGRRRSPCRGSVVRRVERVEIDRSTIWPYDSEGQPREFYYSRYAHPTGAAAERGLGRLEGGDALLYASGTGAATAIVLAFAHAGTTIAIAEGAYFGTSVLFRLLAPFGIEVVEFDQTGPPPPADIVWIEAPANPTLTLPDWKAVRSSAALLVCD